MVTKTIAGTSTPHARHVQTHVRQRKALSTWQSGSGQTPSRHSVLAHGNMELKSPHSFSKTKYETVGPFSSSLSLLSIFGKKRHHAIFGTIFESIYW